MGSAHRGWAAKHVGTELAGCPNIHSGAWGQGTAQGAGLHSRPYLHTTLRGGARPPEASPPLPLRPGPLAPLPSGDALTHTPNVFISSFA